MLITALLPLFTAGCAKQESVRALDVLLAMLAAAPERPAGDIYVLPDAASLTAPKNDETAEQPRIRVADEALLYAAFGEGQSASGDKQIWELSSAVTDDGAMRLSTAASPEEWMVFRCVSRSDTEAVAELFLRRLDALRRQYRDSDMQPMIEHARVVILGKYVLFIVTSEVDSAIEVAKQALS